MAILDEVNEADEGLSLQGMKEITVLYQYNIITITLLHA